MVAGRSDRAESQAQRHLDPIPGEPRSMRAGPRQLSHGLLVGTVVFPQAPVAPRPPQSASRQCPLAGGVTARLAAVPLASDEDGVPGASRRC